MVCRTLRNICGCTTGEISQTRASGLAAAPTVRLPEITILEDARRREAARPRVSECPWRMKEAQPAEKELLGTSNPAPALTLPPLNPKSSSTETEKLTRGWVNLGPQSRSSAYTPAVADKGHVKDDTEKQETDQPNFPVLPQRPHSRRSAPDPDSTLEPAVTPTLHDGTSKIATRGSEYVGAEDQEPSSAVLKVQGARFGHVAWLALSEVLNKSNPSAYSCQHPQIVVGHLIEMRGVCGGGGGGEENTLQAARHYHRRP
ncbi:hypothetical protein BDZ89DRAFT_1079845 [Hymenopellis radicata]|nr:hypothetical protein BDZ89DRAFT_1079845 [Hymenopellis radicata]